MDIKIFDVEHGFCSLVTTDSNRRILIECGHNDDTGFTPTEYLLSYGIDYIDELWISNYDEDHISNLSELRDSVKIGSLWRNKSVTAESLYRIKKPNGISDNMYTLLDMFNSYTGSAQVNNTRNYNDSIFFNRYPTFDDTNNLSAVYFLSYRDIRLCYPGDLETNGWNKLLADPVFCSYLQKVNIFIASHHGRDSGYCPSVFNYCHPDIVIISDEEIQYSTQNQLYQQHARGVLIDGVNRKVLTTRSDGRIGISQPPYGVRKIYL